jgi:hypothetical protein
VKQFSTNGKNAVILSQIWNNMSILTINILVQFISTWCYKCGLIIKIKLWSIMRRINTFWNYLPNKDIKIMAITMSKLYNIIACQQTCPFSNLQQLHDWYVSASLYHAEIKCTNSFRKHYLSRKAVKSYTTHCETNNF